MDGENQQPRLPYWPPAGYCTAACFHCDNGPARQAYALAMLISCWVKSRHVGGWILLLLTANLLCTAVFARASANERSHQKQATSCSYYDPSPNCTEVERNVRRKKFGLSNLEELRRRHERGSNKSELIVGTVAIKQRGGLALVFQRDADGMPSAEIRRMLGG